VVEQGTPGLPRRVWNRTAGDVRISLRAVIIVFALQLLGIGLVVENNGDDAEQATRVAQEAKTNATQSRILIRQNRALINSIIKAEVLECRNDRAARIQGKKRALAIEHLDAFLIDLVAASPVSQSAPETAAAAIATFTRDLERIEILPLPDCKGFEEDLRDALERPDRKPERERQQEEARREAAAGGDASSPPDSPGGG
jgi:hypothetical protein